VGGVWVGCVCPEPLGETCGAPFELLPGEHVQGDLSHAQDDEPTGCDPQAGLPEHVWRFEVSPDVPEAPVVLFTEGPAGTTFVLRHDSCEAPDFLCITAGQAWQGPLLSGTWYLLVSGPAPAPAPYAAWIGVTDPATGACWAADGDGDAVDVCGGDCDDGDPERHPGADERCNGVDDDCDGATDEPGGACPTGGLGVCADGRWVCDPGGERVCEPLQDAQPEVCPDNLDNDCDGFTDERDCVALDPGETCDVARTLQPWELMRGDLSAARDDMRPDCLPDQRGVDHLVVFELPPGPNPRADVGVELDVSESRDVAFELREAPCRGGAAIDCFPAGEIYRAELRPGSYVLLIEASPRSQRPLYAIEMALSLF